MKARVSEGRLRLERDVEEKLRLQNRLSRIEGQVRGLARMVEEDRYCGEIIQQATAIMAALREVSVLCLDDHLKAAIELGAKAGPDEDVPEAKEIAALMRAVLKL